MRTRWLVSINPPVGGQPVEPEKITQLHGPFDTDTERRREAGTIASDLDYPDELVFAAFDVVDGVPVLTKI